MLQTSLLQTVSPCTKTACNNCIWPLCLFPLKHIKRFFFFFLNEHLLLGYRHIWSGSSHWHNKNVSQKFSWLPFKPAKFKIKKSFHNLVLFPVTWKTGHGLPNWYECVKPQWGWVSGGLKHHFWTALGDRPPPPPPHTHTKLKASANLACLLGLAESIYF